MLVALKPSKPSTNFAMRGLAGLRQAPAPIFLLGFSGSVALGDAMRKMPEDWIVQHWADDAGQVTIDAENPKQRLAEVNTAGVESEDDEQEVIAIGRLMAAAPDLLDACRQALKHVKADELIQDCRLNAGDVLRAAIEKATSANS